MVTIAGLAAVPPVVEIARYHKCTGSSVCPVGSGLRVKWKELGLDVLRAAACSKFGSRADVSLPTEGHGVAKLVLSCAGASGDNVVGEILSTAVICCCSRVRGGGD